MTHSNRFCSLDMDPFFQRWIVSKGPKSRVRELLLSREGARQGGWEEDEAILSKERRQKCEGQMKINALYSVVVVAGGRSLLISPAARS